MRLKNGSDYFNQTIIEMKNYESYLFPLFLLAMGAITLSGVNLFGAAILEGAAWKQNVIFALLIIFGMLPPSVREMKTTWSFGGQNGDKRLQKSVL